ncbi:hypothetical protein [Legionella saoudiensis]|uniref:hypothetical protein n=1 Tax=Legionella saoudiensis TaxID=1750561 RepID=UPI000730AA13|nr:hypothetical protein [Legionella saoudiensis]
MPQIIKPIFETTKEELFTSTKHRFFTMFTPIQECTYVDILGNVNKKESDLMAFLGTPVIDSYLETMFAIDSIIHLINAICSASKAMYLWSLKQQQTTSLIDDASKEEFDLAISSLALSVSADIAQSLNLLFSLVSLITRPIASAVQLGVEAAMDHHSQETMGYRA